MSRKQLTQYDITHMGNRTVVDSEWPDYDRDDWCDWEVEDDDIDEF